MAGHSGIGRRSCIAVFFAVRASYQARKENRLALGRKNAPPRSRRAQLIVGLHIHAAVIGLRNKPALALDLMEEFRAPIADSVVQTVINNGEISAGGFSHALESVRMTDETRKTVIQAYERRMATEITHPIFKYKASWRRTVEIQARMILGYLDGSQTEYRGIRIR